MPDAPKTEPPAAKDESQPQQNNSAPPAPLLEQPPSGELTQTDQLNKRLLTSLLERMNAGDADIQRMMASDQNDEDTWETDPGDDPSPT